MLSTGSNIKQTPASQSLLSHHHEAARWSAGKLKLMCSIGSDR